MKNHLKLNKTMPYKIFALLVIASVFSNCKSGKKASDKEKDPIEVSKVNLFEFKDFPLLSDALEEANKQGKWIYMDVGAKWCTPCQMMKKEVYSNKETADFFNKNFVNYLVDGEKNEGPDLRVIFNIKSYPTLLFIDGKGREMLKMESSLSNSALISFGKDALAKKSKPY